MSKSISLLLVLGKLPVPGRPTIWITVGQWPTAGVLCCAGVQINIQTFRVEFFRSLVDHCTILRSSFQGPEGIAFTMGVGGACYVRAQGAVIQPLPKYL